MNRPSPIVHLQAALYSLACLALAAGTARAADLTYSGGSNVWNLSTTNWNSSTVAWTNGNNAIFAGTAETVDIDAAISAGELNFNSSNYTLADSTNNGSLTVTATGTGSSAAIILGTSVTSISISENILLGAAPGTTQSFEMGTGTLMVSGNITENSGSGMGLRLNSGTGGVITLSGTNGYTGGTSSSASGLKININSSGALGTGALTLNATGATTLDNTSASPVTVTNALVLSSTTAGTTGTASITYAGTNDLTISGAVSLTNNDKSIQVNNTGILTLSGAVGEDASPRSFFKRGTGTLVLSSAASTYTGLTNIASGTVEVKVLADGGSASSIGDSSNSAANLVVASGAVLKYTGNGSTTNRAFTIGAGSTGAKIDSSGAGALQFTNSGVSLATGAATGTHLLRLGGTNTGANTIANAIIDPGTSGTTGVTKEDAGTWILTGTNLYSGQTNINGGVLIINGDNLGAEGEVRANAGGTLGGTGFVGGDATIFSGGFLSPGASPGTLTFESALTLRTDGTLIFEGGDLVAVGGTLDLDAGWNLTLLGGFQDGGSVVLFNYGALAASPALSPDFDITALGFTPTSTLTLTNDTVNSRIILNGISLAVPEPSAGLAATLAFIGLLAGRRRRGV